MLLKNKLAKEYSRYITTIEISRLNTNPKYASAVEQTLILMCNNKYIHNCDYWYNNRGPVFART